MDYFDIKISFDSENNISQYFINELIKMEINSYSSSELSLWIIYNTSSAYVQITCCVNKELFNETKFEHNLNFIFSNFYCNVIVEVNSININLFLSKLLISNYNNMNGTHSRKDLS